MFAAKYLHCGCADAEGWLASLRNHSETIKNKYDSMIGTYDSYNKVRPGGYMPAGVLPGQWSYYCPTSIVLVLVVFRQHISVFPLKALLFQSGHHPPSHGRYCETRLLPFVLY